MRYMNMESKELIGGFAVMEFADVDEAIALRQPYAEILGGNLEIDVRQVDQSDYARCASSSQCHQNRNSNPRTRRLK